VAKVARAQAGIRARKSAARARARLEATVTLRSLGQRTLNAVAATDPRFGKFVSQLSARASRLHDLVTNAELIRPNLEPSELHETVGKLKAAVKAAKQLSLTSEIVAVCNPEQKTTKKAVLYRLGLLGAETMTLEEAGALAGVTRERIRQLQAKTEKLLVAKPYLPVYNTALAALNHAVMSGARTASEIEADLRRLGVLGDRDLVTQVVRMAQLRGEAKCSMERRAGHVIIGFRDHLARLRSAENLVVDFIEAETKIHGACPRTAIADVLLQHEFVAEAEDERLALLLEGIPALQALPHENQIWLRVRSRAYTIALMARKVLSVAPHISVSELRRGIRRHHRVKTVPPSSVLARIVADELEDWNLTIDDGVVTARTPASPEATLPSLELTLFQVLSAKGGVMNVNDLLPEVKARGMNVSSFYVMLGYSPIIESYGRSVYGLRGVPVTPGQVETLAAFTQKAPREVRQDFGHLDDGRVWLTRQLGDYEIDHKTLYVPSAFRRYLADGDYSVTMDGSSTPHGVAVSVGQIRLKRNALEGSGAESGDYLLLVFDRRNMTVEIATGDENVLSKASGNEPEATDSNA
jgi:hypothetical protein